MHKLNRLTANQGYNRSKSVFLADQITIIENEICVSTSRFINNQIILIFTHSKLWVTVARHNCKWEKI